MESEVSMVSISHIKSREITICLCSWILTFLSQIKETKETYYKWFQYGSGTPTGYLGTKSIQGCKESIQ